MVIITSHTFPGPARGKGHKNSPPLRTFTHFAGKSQQTVRRTERQGELTQRVRRVCTVQLRPIGSPDTTHLTSFVRGFKFRFHGFHYTCLSHELQGEFRKAVQTGLSYVIRPEFGPGPTSLDSGLAAFSDNIFGKVFTFPNLWYTMTLGKLHNTGATYGGVFG